MTFSFLLITSLCAFGWLSIRHFQIALLLFIALLPTYLIRFSIGPLPTTFLEMGFWILFCAWVFRKITNGTNENSVGGYLNLICSVFSHKVFLYSVGIFGVLSIASLGVVPREQFISSLGLWRAYFFEPFLFSWVLWDSVQLAPGRSFSDKGSETRLRLFLGLVFSGFILAVLGVIQYATRVGIPAPWDIERRITSVFDYPNALGLFLAPILSALLVFGFSTWKNRLRHEKIFIGGASFFIFIAIVLAQTEAALVAIPGTLFIAILISPRQHFLLWLYL
jgi:hypothetical protein